MERSVVFVPVSALALNVSADGITLKGKHKFTEQFKPLKVQGRRRRRRPEI